MPIVYWKVTISKNPQGDARMGLSIVDDSGKTHHLSSSPINRALMESGLSGMTDHLNKLIETVSEKKGLKLDLIPRSERGE